MCALNMRQDIQHHVFQNYSSRSKLLEELGDEIFMIN